MKDKLTLYPVQQLVKKNTVLMVAPFEKVNEISWLESNAFMLVENNFTKLCFTWPLSDFFSPKCEVVCY